MAAPSIATVSTPQVIRIPGGPIEPGKLAGEEFQTKQPPCEAKGCKELADGTIGFGSFVTPEKLAEEAGFLPRGIMADGPDVGSLVSRRTFDACLKHRVPGVSRDAFPRS